MSDPGYIGGISVIHITADNGIGNGTISGSNIGTSGTGAAKLIEVIIHACGLNGIVAEGTVSAVDHT